MNGVLCFVRLAAGPEIAHRSRKTTWTGIASVLLGARVTTVALGEILSCVTPPYALMDGVA